MAADTSNSRFAVTCGLLRRYIREHPQPEHQLAGLGLSRAFRLSLPPMRQARNRDEETEARTMQLFPKEQAKTKPAETLTILFEGRVLVFEDFPADKAKELIEMLEWASSPVPDVPQKPVVAGLSNLPLARKASLQHFLEKRKHRIRAAYNPYKKMTKLKDVAASKPVEVEHWLWL